jgi:hypothetical protein
MEKQIDLCASRCTSDKERNRRLRSVGKILMIYVPFNIRFHKKKARQSDIFFIFYKFGALAGGENKLFIVEFEFSGSVGFCDLESKKFHDLAKFCP